MSLVPICLLPVSWRQPLWYRIFRWIGWCLVLPSDLLSLFEMDRMVFSSSSLGNGSRQLCDYLLCFLQLAWQPYFSVGSRVFTGGSFAGVFLELSSVFGLC